MGFADVWNAIMDQFTYSGPFTLEDLPGWLEFAYGSAAPQLVNFFNITNCQLGSQSTDACKGFVPVPGLTADDVRAWEADSWIMSVTRETLNDKMPCPPGWDCQGTQTVSCGNKYAPGAQCKLDWASTGMTNYSWNVMVMGAYYVCLYRISDLCSPIPVDEVWPYFYYMYDTSYGQLIVDDFLERKAIHHDHPLAQALRLNYTDDIQRKYGLLNMPNMWDIYNAWNIALWFESLVNEFEVRASLAQAVFMHTIKETGQFNRLGHPLWTPAQRKAAYDQLLLSRVPRDDALMQGYWQYYEDQGWLEPGNPGGPPVVTPPPGAGGQDNPWDKVPGYSGKLPKPIETLLKGQRIGGSGDTKDPTAKQVCVAQAGFLERWVPIVGGIIGAVFGGALMPGNKSKLIAAISLGGGAYSLLRISYGWTAFQNWEYENTGEIDIPAYFLSIGAFPTVVAFLYDINEWPAFLDYGENVVLVAAGGVSYAILFPVLAPILGAVGTVVDTLTLPIAILERIVEAFSSGCVTANVDGACLCQDANRKDLLTTSILTDIYGVTEEQLTMRTACMRTAMMTGEWGSDPLSTGFCDANGDQTNPVACADSIWFTAKNISQVGPVGIDMYQAIAPCLDPSNPVFLPPTAADAECKSLGPHFRKVNGQCIDYGVDTWRDPTEKSSNNECIIL